MNDAEGELDLLREVDDVGVELQDPVSSGVDESEHDKEPENVIDRDAGGVLDGEGKTVNERVPDHVPDKGAVALAE